MGIDVDSIPTCTATTLAIAVHAVINTFSRVLPATWVVSEPVELKITIRKYNINLIGK